MTEETDPPTPATPETPPVRLVHSNPEFDPPPRFSREWPGDDEFDAGYDPEFEERMQRRVVRETALSVALRMFGPSAPNLKPDDVIAAARRFEAYLTAATETDK